MTKALKSFLNQIIALYMMHVLAFFLIGKRVNNIYLLDLHNALFNIHCLLTKEDDTWL